MPTLEYFLVAESISVDQFSNRISLFNVVEYANPKVGMIPSAVAVSFWNIADGDEGKDFQVVLRVITAGGTTRDASTNFRMVRPRHRIMQHLVGIPVEKEGEVKFEILLNGNHVASHTVLAIAEDVEVLEETPGKP
jgi:hypothetical protein